MTRTTVACLDMAGTMVAGHGQALTSQADSTFQQDYARAASAGEVIPVPGATETLAVLRAGGIKICLMTGFSPATRDAVIEALGWWPLIDLALSPAEAGRERPWPDLPLTALLRLGGQAVSELAVAGDTVSDVESGLRAGAGVVAGVLTGAASADQFAEAGAPYIVESVTALIPLLGVGR